MRFTVISGFSFSSVHILDQVFGELVQIIIQQEVLQPAHKEENPHPPSVFIVKALSRWKGLEFGGKSPVTSPFHGAELLGIVHTPNQGSLPCIQVVTNCSAQWNVSGRVYYHLMEGTVEMQVDVWCL